MATFSPTIDHYQAAATLAQALADLIKNPKIVVDITKNTLEASQLSADRKKELEVALATLTEAKLTSEQLKQDKEDHRKYLESTLKELDQRELQLNAEQASLERAKQAFQTDVTHVSVHLDARLKEADDRHVQLDTRTTNAIQHERDNNEHEAKLVKWEKQLDAREEKLKDELAKLAAKKKKLADAAAD